MFEAISHPFDRNVFEPSGFVARFATQFVPVAPRNQNEAALWHEHWRLALEFDPAMSGCHHFHVHHTGQLRHFDAPGIGEFGVAVENAGPGEFVVRYTSGNDLLSKTPEFYQQVMRDRLHRKFNRVYRYIEVLYDGQNPYIDAISNNISHLVRIIESGDWSLLRREPQYFLGIVNAVNELESLAKRQLASFTGIAIETDRLLMPI